MYNKKSVLYSICLFLFIDSVGSGLVFPILPALFIDQDYGLLTHDYYFSKEILYGLSFAIFPMASIFGMPILGQMADKYGKGLIMLYGVLGFIMTDLLCIVAIMVGNIWLFLFSRLLMGFLSGTYAAGMAMISDISNNDDDRISNFKLSTLASLIGVFLGPGFSIFIDSESQINPFIMPFVIVTILSICSFTVLWFNFRKIGIKMSYSSLLTEGRVITTNVTYVCQNHLSLSMMVSFLLSVFTSTSTRLLFISFFFVQFGFGLYNQSLSLFLVTTFLYTPQNMGILLIMISIVSIVSMYLLQPLIAKYYKYQFQVKINLVLAFVLLILYASYSLISDNNLEEYKGVSLSTVLILELLIPFIMLGFTNLFANSVNKSEQGKIMGSSGQISSIATMISGLLVGKLLATGYFLLITLSAVALILGYIALRSYLIQQVLTTTID